MDPNSAQTLQLYSAGGWCQLCVCIALSVHEYVNMYSTSLQVMGT